MQRIIFYSLLLMACYPATAGEYFLLNHDWQYKKLQGDEAFAAINLPHTYNAYDADDGGEYYRGPALYQTEFVSPCQQSDVLYLEFEGVATNTEVLVNGHVIGAHHGAFTRFRFAIPQDYLRPSNLQQNNQLLVKVDNANNNAVAPLGGDFSIFGGIYRSVRLLCSSKIHFDLDDYGSDGIYINSTIKSKDLANIDIVSRVTNSTSVQQPVRLVLDILDPQNKSVAKKERSFVLENQQTKVISEFISIQFPQLWDGVNNPALYQLQAKLVWQGQPADSKNINFGIRSIKIDPDQGLLLNGNKYSVHGVNYHLSQRPGKGTAVSSQEEQEDFKILDELGLTGIRLAHYPHPQPIYEHADRKGYLLWSEIPIVASVNNEKQFIDNAQYQLKEMIRQNYNHASVFVWGVGNEIYDANPESVEIIKTLHDLAKTEDPSRLTVYANCCGAIEQGIATQTDLSASNIYHGWYPQQQGEMTEWLDQAHEQLKSRNRALAVSEYGAGGSIFQQEDPPSRPKTDSFWHPEQYQSLVHETSWQAIAAKDYLLASFAWVAFDFASDGRQEGDRAGINDKGLVTYDRKTKKDSFYWYKANWSKEPVVYITSRRYRERKIKEVNVKVYSNQPALSLFLNGVLQSKKDVVDHMVNWDIELTAGQNIVVVKNVLTGLSNEVSWILEK